MKTTVKLIIAGVLIIAGTTLGKKTLTSAGKGMLGF
jgi:hypothetical protein